LGSGQTEFFQPLAGNDTITGMAGRGWGTAVDYSSNSSSQPVSVVLGNSNNLGTALDGFDSDLLAPGLQPYTDTLINVDLVRGGAGNDSLVGGSYNQGATGIFVEQFRGNAGNDTIDGGGSDTVIGAYGVADRVDYSNSGPVTVNLATGTAFDGFGGTDTLIDINVVRASNFSDTLIGGNPAFDNLERFEGRGGNDFIDGGSGNDEADYSTSTAPVLVNLGTGTAFDGFGGTDTLMSVEWARGGSANDTLIGGANALERLTGGAGNDMIDGGSLTGVNYASFVLGPSGASAFVENGSGMAFDDGQGGTDTLVNINGLWGSNFNDTLTGGLGDQWFVGQGGDDLIDGGAGNDTVSYLADPNGVTVNLALGTATDGWGSIWNLQGTDILLNIENIEGSSFNDTLIGNGGANVITGGGGTDILTGDAGADTFKFDAISDSSADLLFSDVITDFLHETDKIDLSAIDANTGLGGDQDFLFGGNDASTVANSVTWSEDVVNNRTILHIDNSGDTVADMQIVLQGTGLGLTDADFIL
jgi:Ca2+-binding RTX toxin-like protein